MSRCGFEMLAWNVMRRRSWNTTFVPMSLPDLTETDLEKLGVSLGDSKRFLKAIAALQIASSADSQESDQVFYSLGAFRRQPTRA
jgi:hypothetical protein